MYQIFLQIITLPMIVSSLTGIMIHETHLDSAITKAVANRNDVIIKAEISNRLPHTHSHEKPVLEQLRSLGSGRVSAKRNKGENEKKYLIQKRSTARVMTTDGLLINDI